MQRGESTGRVPLGVRVATASARIRADVLLAVIDAALAATAFLLALLLRFDGEVPRHYWIGFFRYLPLAICVILVVNRTCGLYRQIWRHAGILEARRVVIAGVLGGGVLLVLHHGFGHQVVTRHLVPGSVVVAGVAANTMLLGAQRFQSRLFVFQRREQERGSKRVLIVGAGQAGAMLIRDMTSSESDLMPVALLDDNSRKHGRSIHGVPVIGAIGDLVWAVVTYDVDQVVLAIPSADAALTRRVADLAEAGDVPIRVIPSVDELVSERVTIRDIRDVRIDDLLGRQQVATDLDAVGQLVRGRRVLITGAGGSIGAEIARQVASFAPARLYLLDHDETHLHDAIAGLGENAVPLLADIRDESRISRIFAWARPELVFHAAAHKHVPMLETHPCEAARTNVLGTANVVRAARAFDVARFVFISTDKAVQPSSVMGASKRVAETLVLGADSPGNRFCAVRFGNVLGSRGSVLPTFLRQIAAGGPVTVTDPRMTRFFMSIPEAVQLVLQAAVLSEGGEVFMLEMGEPVRILDLAQRMIRLAGWQVGTDVEIRITGPRPGEKLEEELFAPEEEPTPTAHPSILRLAPERIPNALLTVELDRLATYAATGDDEAVRQLLFGLGRGADPGAHDAPHEVITPDVIDLTRAEAWSRSSI